MDSKDQKFNGKRRIMLKQVLVAGVGTIAVGSLLKPTAAHASKATKAAMMYMDKPHGKDQCSGCNQFEPGKTATANGTCKVVEGSISPHGWCVAFTPKA